MQCTDHEPGLVRPAQRRLVVVVMLAQPRQPLRARVGGLDQFHRPQRVQEIAGQRRRLLAHPAGGGLHAAPARPGRRQLQRQRRQHQEREHGVQPEHQAHQQRQVEHAADQGQGRVDDEALDLGEVTVETGRHVTEADPGIVVLRQRLQVREHLLAQPEQHVRGQVQVTEPVPRLERQAGERQQQHGSARAGKHPHVAGHRPRVDQHLGQVGDEHRHRAGGAGQRDDAQHAGPARGHQRPGDGEYVPLSLFHGGLALAPDDPHRRSALVVPAGDRDFGRLAAAWRCRTPKSGRSPRPGTAPCRRTRCSSRNSCGRSAPA